MFWCGWFQVFVVEIKITIITATFLPEQVATTAAPPTTVSPRSGQRRKYLLIVCFRPRPSALRLQVETFF